MVVMALVAFVGCGYEKKHCPSNSLDTIILGPKMQVLTSAFPGVQQKLISTVVFAWLKLGDNWYRFQMNCKRHWLRTASALFTTDGKRGTLSFMQHAFTCFTFFVRLHGSNLGGGQAKSQKHLSIYIYIHIYGTPTPQESTIFLIYWYLQCFETVLRCLI